MYMPGRLRTGSSPSRTVMSAAVYVVVAMAELPRYGHGGGASSRGPRRNACPARPDGRSEVEGQPSRRGQRRRLHVLAREVADGFESRHVGERVPEIGVE